MIWHGFWWQWTAGGAEALLVFMLMRYYTSPVRKMNAVGITFGDSKHPSKVTGKQFQRLKREHRQYGGPEPHKHCADCNQAFDLVDSQIYKVTLCAKCLYARQDWRRRATSQAPHGYRENRFRGLFE
jgi:hypothetical protein